MLAKILFPILLIFLIQAKQISPLRYGYDDASNDINLSFNGKRFLLSLQNSIPYSEAVFCFRPRKVTNNDATGTCYLDNQKEIYDCLTIDLIQHVGLHWQADYQLNPSSSQTPFTFSYFLNSTTLIYSLDGKINGNQTFEYLSEESSIYQVVALSYDPYVVNRVFTHTFSVPDQVRTDNIFFQRQVQCFAQKDINYLIFLGGVIRDQIDIYMVAFLNYSRTEKPFSFWGGLSFSSDKSSRDMLGVFPLKDNYADLYSLYAAPPYKDISINVNGTQDWTKISSSFQATQGQLSTYYFMSLYRYYQTVNSKGDEEIILKMNNKYCFVASTDPIVFLLGVQQPYVQNYMHTVLQCFNPNIELYSTLLALSLICMILFLLLI